MVAFAQGWAPLSCYLSKTVVVLQTKKVEEIDGHQVVSISSSCCIPFGTNLTSFYGCDIVCRMRGLTCRLLRPTTTNLSWALIAGQLLSQLYKSSLVLKDSLLFASLVLGCFVAIAVAIFYQNRISAAQQR